MKKYLLAACLALVAGPAMAAGGFREIPSGPAYGLATADFGGVSIASMTFSSSNVILWGPGTPLDIAGANTGGGSGSIAFIHVTSANAAATLTDAIIIRSTGTFTSTTTVSGGTVGSGDYSTGNEVYRIFVGTAIGTGAGYQNQWVSNGSTGFDYVFPKPIRLTNGAMIKTTSVNFGPIIVGFTDLGR